MRPLGQPLRGSLKVPGDKSIGHRAVMLAALADGTSRLQGLSSGADNRATREAFAKMGVAMESDGRALLVHGPGLDGLRTPDGEIDCGNSGTTLRVLLGVLSAQPFSSRVTGDESLRRRPLGRVLRPLRGRGARCEGTLDTRLKDETAPVEVLALDGHRRLWELDYTLPIASAQVKSALLLSGLYADGPTALREPTVSRDHTERMLVALGAPLQTMGPAVLLDPSGWDRRLPPLDLTLPGDPSSAAFLVGAALLHPRSRMAVRSVNSNPTRTGFVEVLRDLGADLAWDPKGETHGEPLGDLHVGSHGGGSFRRGGVQRGGVQVGGELAVRCLDEVPLLVALAATIPGRSEFTDLSELRVKESDRIEALAAMLRAFGVSCETRPDGLALEGGGLRAGAVVDSRGDHRIAMAAAVLALGAPGETRVLDTGCVDTSFPGFIQALRALGGDLEEA
ncbi:MAG: 3-phosphoshikimate 1-carboxyvinyltransferase [Deltaproteobacteria bacterium]|nr:3-phosphoshikimate 1-carboxyvinyltransferase [Deltaproteobacteria bacterium]